MRILTARKPDFAGLILPGYFSTSMPGIQQFVGITVITAKK